MPVSREAVSVRRAFTDPDILLAGPIGMGNAEWSSDVFERELRPPGA
ncbi:hypothetical protein [Streptomyces sp. NPDC088400]